jgi:hypothetical protein
MWSTDTNICLLQQAETKDVFVSAHRIIWNTEE